MDGFELLCTLRLTLFFSGSGVPFWVIVSDCIPVYRVQVQGAACRLPYLVYVEAI